MSVACSHSRRANAAFSLAGPNACNSHVPCVLDPSTCSTGQAAGALSSNWFCPATVPPGAVHNGAGERCFDTALNCSSAPNQCDGNNSANHALTSPLHCYPNNATCASGQAGGQGHVFFCDQTQPPGAIPNGAGQLCYNASSWCLLGPNACGASVWANATVLGGALLAGGQWGGAAFSGPAQVLGTLQASGNVTSGGVVVGCVTAVLYSETNFSVAVVGASCSSSAVLGEALGADHTVYSSANLLGLIDPAGPGAQPGIHGTLLFSIAPITAPGGYVVPTGAIVGTVTVVGGANFSVLYGSVSCQLDLVTCSSGQAGPTSNNWFCETDYPAGSVANGAGQLCYASAETWCVPPSEARILRRVFSLLACERCLQRERPQCLRCCPALRRGHSHLRHRRGRRAGLQLLLRVQHATGRHPRRQRPAVLR